MKRLASLLGLALFVVGCAHQTMPQVTPAIDVSVSKPVEREVTDYVEFTGRTDATNTVDVRARINGYLVKVNFKDGQYVKKGEVLFEIDPRPYEASLAVAKGELARANGEKKLADVQVERYTKLVSEKAASQQALDEWVGKQAASAGSVEATKAQVLSAQLNLDFCTLTSPIDGQISRAYYQIGNLVTPDNMTLTNIVTVDPIYAYFSVDEATYQRVITQVREGMLDNKGGLSAVPVEMGLTGDVERKFPIRGTLDFVNNQIDRTTATITLRGVFENPYDEKTRVPPLLKPGLFCRVRLPIGKPRKGLLVNEQAIGTDQGYKFVYVVNDKDQVEYRRVTLGPQEKGLQTIDGIKAGEWVVVKGLQRCRANGTVKPEKVDMTTLQPVADKK
jgi:multidrug efflux system membrane fusion protein